MPPVGTVPNSLQAHFTCSVYSRWLAATSDSVTLQIVSVNSFYLEVWELTL